MKLFKDDVVSVPQGSECGLSFEKYDLCEAGDVIECIRVSEERASLDEVKDFNIS